MTLSLCLAFSMVVLTLCTVGFLAELIDRNLERAVLPGQLARMEDHIRLQAAQIESYVAGAHADVLAVRAEVPIGAAAPYRDSVSSKPGEWHVSVTDNGIGMDAAHGEKIFEMFRRLHDRGRYPGSGVGLAIARRAVERHGGRMWAESSPGRGTTVHFTISDSAADIPAAAAE